MFLSTSNKDNELEPKLNCCIRCACSKNKRCGGRLVYRLGGNAACQVVVDDGDVVLGQMDVKLYVGCTLQRVWTGTFLADKKNGSEKLATADFLLTQRQVKSDFWWQPKTLSVLQGHSEAEDPICVFFSGWANKSSLNCSKLPNILERQRLQVFF